MCTTCFSTVEGWTKKVLCVVCVLGVIAPSAMLSGIIVMVLPNSRSAAVDAFNAAAREFNANSSDSHHDWRNCSVSINEQPGQVLNVSIAISGSTEGVDMSQAVSRFAETLLPTTISSSVALNFSLFSGDVRTSQFTRTVTTQRITAIDFTCSVTTCSYSTLAAQCAQSFLGTYSGGACSSGQKCGTCFYSEYLTQYCAVVARGVDSELRESSKYKSCLYPFDERVQRYGISQPSSIPVRVYLEDDPFLTLQRVTSGSQNFGLSKREQIKLGGILLGVGGGLLFVVGVLAAVIVYRVIANQKKRRAAGIAAEVGVTVRVVTIGDIPARSRAPNPTDFPDDINNTTTEIIHPFPSSMFSSNTNNNRNMSTCERQSFISATPGHSALRIDAHQDEEHRALTPFTSDDETEQSAAANVEKRGGDTSALRGEAATELNVLSCTSVEGGNNTGNPLVAFSRDAGSTLK